MSQRHGGEHDRRLFVVWAALVIIGFTLCFALGYYLAARVFNLTDFAAHLTSGLLGLLAFIAGCALFKLCAELYERNHPGRSWSRAFDYNAFIRATLDAMNRIARGDFNILMPIEGGEPFREVAESVNKMARELATMETLRQDFISNVSHEIQSPLTSISGFAALLRGEGLNPEQRNHYLDVIETESRRLSGLSENLLKLSTLEADARPLKRAEFRLDRQIESAALALEPQWAAKQLELSLNLEKIAIVGDVELLTQLWTNLLHNAIKFTPQGGNIALSLTHDAQNVYVTIADSGIGIAKEDQPRLFERFYKVDKARDRSLGGNGLGLSLVKKIVELHGGKIDLHSEIGEGTEFVVQLSISLSELSRSSSV